MKALAGSNSHDDVLIGDLEDLSRYEPLPSLRSRTAMSGLVGVFDGVGTGIAREDLRAMLASIDHRGPDGSGEWYDDTVALGHQQLQSTPESRFDDQPYRDDELVVVCDVRLDNRGELIDRLDVDGERTIPDSHLLLAAHIGGGGALSRAPDRVVRVRHLGRGRGDLLRSRSVRRQTALRLPRMIDVRGRLRDEALSRSVRLSPAVDEVNIGGLPRRHVPRQRTFYQSLRRSRPLTRRDGSGRRHRRVAVLGPRPDADDLLRVSAAYERRFRELFEQAVDCRLRSSGTVGTSLSGGLDSSSITVMAGSCFRSNNHASHVLNVYDDAPSADEQEFIESVTDGEESVITCFWTDRDLRGPRGRCLSTTTCRPCDAPRNLGAREACRARERRRTPRGGARGQRKRAGTVRGTAPDGTLAASEPRLFSMVDIIDARRVTSSSTMR